MNIPSSRTYAWWLALLRIFTGVFWLSHAIGKFTNARAFLPPSGFMANVVGKAATGTAGPYHAFIVSIVQPHIDLFAQFVRFGEVAAGILLVLGLFTRLGGLLGVFLGANYLLAMGYSASAGWSSLEAAAIALSAVQLVLPTGRVLGLDGLWGHSRYSAPDDMPAMPIPPRRPEPQATASTSSPASGDATPTNTVTTTKGTISATPAEHAPGPNGSNGGPEFAAPASAGPQVDQGGGNGPTSA